MGFALPARTAERGIGAIVQALEDKLTQFIVYRVFLFATFVFAFFWILLSLNSNWDLPARNIDGRYLVAAARCALEGLSPYGLSNFSQCWREIEPVFAHASFVFPPQVIVMVLPVGLLDRPAADFALIAFLVGIWMVLGVYVLRFVWRPSEVSMRVVTAPLWCFLALTNTGVFGALLTGQPSLIPATGLGILAFCLLHPMAKGWTVGAVLVLTKPHLAMLSAALMYLWPGQRNLARIALAICVAALANLWIFILDPGFIQNVTGSLGTHVNSDQSKLDDPTLLFGLRSLIVLVSAGISPWLSASFLVLTTAIIGAVAVTKSGNRTEAALAVVILASAFIVPHKPYDFAIYSIVFVLCARQPFLVQAVLLPLMLLIWRPNLAAMFMPDVNLVLFTNLVLASLILVFAAIGLWGRSPSAWEGEGG